jgi:hypothetical protein
MYPLNLLQSLWKNSRTVILDMIILDMIILSGTLLVMTIEELDVSISVSMSDSLSVNYAWLRTGLIALAFFFSDILSHVKSL